MSLAARAQIVAHLDAHLPEDYTVLEFARDIDDVAETTVMVETRRIEPGPSSGTRQATCSILVVARFEDYVAAETALEDAVVEVLDALDQLPNISLVAERVDIAGADGTAKHHGYRVDLVVPVVKDTHTPEE